MPHLICATEADESEDEGYPLVQLYLFKTLPKNFKGVFHYVATRLLIAYHLTGEVAGVLVMRLENSFRLSYVDWV